MPENEHDWLTVAEVAVVGRVTPLTVRRWIKAGILSVKRVGIGRGRLRIHRDEMALVFRYAEPEAD